MKKQRRKHSLEFKARVALEAIKGVKTVSQIAQEYEIHPVMVSNWKKEMLNNLPDVFDKNKRPKTEKDIEKEKEQLQRKVGELTMDVEFLEKKVQAVGTPRQRSELIGKDSHMSISRQCRLLRIHCSMIYYDLSEETVENLELMKKLDHLYLEDPSAGSRRMSSCLRRQTGKATNRKRVRRLMRVMGIEAIYPRTRTTISGGPSGIYPYRLKGLTISRPNQVWCADITFIPMRRGYIYLFAIMDWYSRKVIDWELSTILDLSFWLDCLKRAIQHSGIPENHEYRPRQSVYLGAMDNFTQR